MSVNEMTVGGPTVFNPPPQIELRVGQIYQERGKEPPRYVQVVQLRDEDDCVVLQRIAPAPANALGRRTTRRRRKFKYYFEFVYEEVVASLCPQCAKKILTRHYPGRTESEYCGQGGLCWDCFLGAKKK